MTAPWLRACSAVRQYVRVGCRSEPFRTLGCVEAHPVVVTEQVCHPHHSHPAAPPNPKTLCKPAALCLGRPKNKASDPRIQARHASLLGALNLRNHSSIVHRPSSTFLHVADLPKASTKPCNILAGRNMSSICRATQPELLTTVTSPTGMLPTPGPGNRSEGLDHLAKRELEQKVRRQSGALRLAGQQFPGASTGSNS